MKPKVKRPPVKQFLAEDIKAHLERFIRLKWYGDDPVRFAKDRHLIQKWVIFRLATRLERQGVTIPGARYKEIMEALLMDALRFGQAELRNPVAFLSTVVQRHLDHHAEDYYEEGKALRNQVQNALLIASKLPPREPNPVAEMAQAARLIRPKTRPAKAPSKAQLNLL